MRAIGMWQPWGHWLVNGDKAVETRPRPIRTLVGERVAIHATLREPLEARADAVTAALRAGLELPDLDKLPHGALIGTVHVIDCVQMTPAYLAMMRSHPRELALGNYAVGRWALAVKDPVRFPRPVPWKGSQGVFMVPDEVIRTASCTTCLGLGTVTEPNGCFSSAIRPCRTCRAHEQVQLDPWPFPPGLIAS